MGASGFACQCLLITEINISFDKKTCEHGEGVSLAVS